MKNPAGKPMPTTLHDRSQFTEKNPSRSEAERCLLSLDWWRFFCFCPVLLNTLAGLCVHFGHSRHSLKTTECPRERVFISLARATIVVTTQARHTHGTVNLDLGCQVLGADVEKSSHGVFKGTGQSISAHCKGITGNASGDSIDTSLMRKGTSPCQVQSIPSNRLCPEAACNLSSQSCRDSSMYLIS